MKVTFHARLDDYEETQEFEDEPTEHEIGMALRRWARQDTPIDYWFTVEK